jgi:hypothetical protein
MDILKHNCTFANVNNMKFKKQDDCKTGYQGGTKAPDSCA